MLIVTNNPQLTEKNLLPKVYFIGKIDTSLSLALPTDDYKTHKGMLQAIGFWHLCGVGGSYREINVFIYIRSWNLSGPSL